MRLLKVIAATMVLLLAALSYGQDEKAKSKPQTNTAKPKSGAPKAKIESVPDEVPRAPDLIIDDRWNRQPGDKASAYSKDGSLVYAARDLFSYGEALKFENANDTEGLKDLIRRNRIKIIENKTSVLLINPLPNQPESYPCGMELRVLEGEMKDEKIYIRMDRVQRLIPKPINPAEEKLKKAKADAERSRAKSQTPEARAASLLSIAKNLEKSGKTKPALENYRKVVADFGDTPSAKEASERIKALGGK